MANKAFRALGVKNQACFTCRINGGHATYNYSTVVEGSPIVDLLVAYTVALLSIADGTFTQLHDSKVKPQQVTRHAEPQCSNAVKRTP